MARSLSTSIKPTTSRPSTTGTTISERVVASVIRYRGAVETSAANFVAFNS
jgi:hypothetical protein